MGKHQKKRGKYISKGERPSANKEMLKRVRRMVTPLERELNKIRIFAKGGYSFKNKAHDPYVTIPNPDKKNTKERLVRVRLSTLHKEMKPRKATA